MIVHSRRFKCVHTIPAFQSVGTMDVLLRPFCKSMLMVVASRVVVTRISLLCRFLMQGPKTVCRVQLDDTARTLSPWGVISCYHEHNKPVRYTNRQAHPNNSISDPSTFRKTVPRRSSPTSSCPVAMLPIPVESVLLHRPHRRCSRRRRRYSRCLMMHRRACLRRHWS